MEVKYQLACRRGVSSHGVKGQQGVLVLDRNDIPLAIPLNAVPPVVPQLRDVLHPRGLPVDGVSHTHHVLLLAIGVHVDAKGEVQNFPGCQ
jgi:hypothetical protein